MRGAAMAVEAMAEEEGWAGMGGDALRFDGIRLDAKVLEVAARLQILALGVIRQHRSSLSDHALGGEPATSEREPCHSTVFRGHLRGSVHQQLDVGVRGALDCLQSSGVNSAMTRLDLL